MRNTKLVKARCKKTGAAFGLEVRAKGRGWEVVNFVRLTDAEDAAVASEVTVTDLKTADCLLPCSACGSRKVGGCRCACGQGRRCSKNDKYHYQCIYCSELELERAAAGGLTGETVTLAQGQVVSLRRNGADVSNLLVGMGWSPSVFGANMDLDSSVVMINARGAVEELVYFGNLKDRRGSIQHYGDNLYGSKKTQGQQDKDDENITVDLSRVPSQVQCLAFVVNIYSCHSRHQNLGMVRDMHIRLIEKNTGEVLVRYLPKAQSAGATAILLGAAYRQGSGWAFKAMNQTYNVDRVQTLAEKSCDACRSLLR